MKAFLYNNMHKLCIDEYLLTSAYQILGDWNGRRPGLIFIINLGNITWDTQTVFRVQLSPWWCLEKRKMTDSYHNKSILCWLNTEAPNWQEGSQSLMFHHNYLLLVLACFEKKWDNSLWANLKRVIVCQTGTCVLVWFSAAIETHGNWTFIGGNVQIHNRNTFTLTQQSYRISLKTASWLITQKLLTLWISS